MSIGIDIGKYSIKIVQLSTIDNKVKIDNIGSFNTFNDLTKFNLDTISKSQLSASIEELVKKLNINPKKIKKITSSLSGNAIDARQITTLDMPDNELLVSLELEAKKHMPLDGTDAIIDYHHLGTSNNELDKIDVILVTTTKNKIKDHADILSSSGFKPGVFDADPVALSNLYQHSYELPEKGADVILNIGHTSTTLIAWGKDSSFFTREIEIGGHEINKNIIQELNLNYKEATKIKETKGINAFDQKNNNQEENNSGIAIEKKTIFNDLIDEIRKTLRFYLKKNNQSFFNTFYLCGGCANIPGLKDFISSNLNLKIELFDLFKNINNETEVENPLQYTLAIGLALRGLEE